MEKVLHAYFLVQMTDNSGKTTGKSLSRYDRHDVSFLIDGANNHVEQAKDRAQNQVILDQIIYNHLDEFLNRGLSINLINRINRNISVVGHQCHLVSDGKTFSEIFVAHMPHSPPMDVFVSFMFSRMASFGWLQGLKRCRNPNCRRFFLGRPNVKWCKKSCGSLVRVRAKRKRDAN